MDIIIIVAGLAWIVYGLIKDANIKQAPKDTDYKRAISDHYSGKYTRKEIDKRITSGYYVNKDNK